MRPAEQLYRLAGSPPQDGCADHRATCVVCAADSPRTALYSSWQGSSFTDQNKLRGHGLSSRVCEPCVWAHSWVAPPDKPANAPGTKGLNLRLFSHVCDARGYHSLSKGEKPAIRDWLRSPKVGAWWCAIADTGQKHTIPWTRTNAAGAQRGIVRFEERDVVLGDWSDVELATRALTAGVTKDELTTGLYTPRAWALAEALVREVEVVAQRHRGGGWWSLVVWLAQRDEEAVAQRLAEEQAAKAAKKEAARGQRAASRGGEGRGGRAGARAAGRGAGGGDVAADALGSAPRPDAGRGAVERVDRDVRDDDAARPAPRGAQLGLFGGGGDARRGGRR